jgi:hypothetical protein
MLLCCPLLGSDWCILEEVDASAQPVIVLRIHASGCWQLWLGWCHGIHIWSNNCPWLFDFTMSQVYSMEVTGITWFQWEGIERLGTCKRIGLTANWGDYDRYCWPDTG